MSAGFDRTVHDELNMAEFELHFSLSMLEPESDKR